LTAAPTVTSVSPSNGSTAGGNVVTITGSGFTGATAVNFGFRPAVAFNVITDTSISATVPVGTVGTVDIRVTAASQTSPPTPSDFYTYTQPSWKGIISQIDENKIILFHTGTGTIDGTILMPSPSPSAVYTPDGTTIYAVDSSQPSLMVVNAATNTLTTTISLPPIVGAGGFDIIVSPDGTKIYTSNNFSGYVTVIDTATNTVVANLFVATNLGALSITPDGKTVYVGNFSLSNVFPIDTATNTVGPGIPTGVVPGLLSITPDGKKGFMGDSLSDNVSVLDLTTNTVVNTIAFPAGSGPYGSSILPNGTTIYVANIYNDTVTVIDVATDTIITTIPFPAGSGPFWAAATPDGKTVYVANLFADNVIPIDTATNTAGAPITAFMGDLQNIGMSPDPAPVAAFSSGMITINLPAQFDASASLSPIGTITTYMWDFGDGTIVTTNTPLINHTYTSTGVFNVVLTVTNSAGTSTAKVYSSRFMSNNGGPSAVISHLIDVSPSPPIDLRGKQKACRFPSQTDLINIISWRAPLNEPLPAYYRIYRDAGLIDLVGIVFGSEPLIFKDHNRRKHIKYTYYIVSVSSEGTVSLPATLTVFPKK